MHFFIRLKNTSVFLLVPLGSLLSQPSVDSVLEGISFQQAFQRAVINDPRLELNRIIVEAAEGQIEQANSRPNPVIGAEAENFLGTGPLRGTQGLEVTIGISQVIETANKRERRVELARADRILIDWDRELILAEIESSVRTAFVDVLLAQEFLNLRREQLDLAQRSVDETASMVEAARSSHVELMRARLDVHQQRFAIQQAERALVKLKSVLAGYWGDSGHESFAVVGQVTVESGVPEFSELAGRLAYTANLARYSAEENAREMSLEMEQARANPDLEVFAGGRYFNETDGDVGFVAGISMPWPLSDRNQGNIRIARARLRAVFQEREVTRRSMTMALNRSYQEAVGARAEVMSIETNLLPAAEATLRDTEHGYERGQFNQLVVLESRNVLFEVREAYLNALQRYALAQAEIEALTRPATIIRK